jgi:hypothetical protein
MEFDGRLAFADLRALDDIRRDSLRRRLLD